MASTQTALPTSQQAMTLRIQHSNTQHRGDTFRVFDTPNISSVKLGRQAIEHLWLLPLGTATMHGIDAFVFAFECGRFVDHKMQSYLDFKEFFGPDVAKHTVLVFTKCGKHTGQDIFKEMLQICLNDPSCHQCALLTEFNLRESYGSRLLALPAAFGQRQLDEDWKDRDRILQAVGVVLARTDEKPYDNDALRDIRRQRAQCTNTSSPLHCAMDGFATQSIASNDQGQDFVSYFKPAILVTFTHAFAGASILALMTYFHSWQLISLTAFVRNFLFIFVGQASIYAILWALND